MIGVSNIKAAQQTDMSGAVDQAKLSSDDTGEGEIVAIIRAIPEHNRREVLAGLQALICADATHIVKASFVA